MAVRNINRQMSKTPMGELPVERRIACFDEVALGYTEEEAANEARRCAHCKNPGCMQRCPAHNRIPDFIADVVAGDYASAYRTLRQTSAFPGVCSRVCAQELQCEAGCLRGRNGHAPVAIGRLERFVADYALAHGIDFDQHFEGPDLVGANVAIVGAGPAGIAAATDLSALGAHVHVYDEGAKPGGILTFGIPEFCLPKSAVEASIAALEQNGVVFDGDARVDDVAKLMRDGGYDAVFLAHGAPEPRPGNFGGSQLAGIWDASSFLADAAEARLSDMAGTACVVIGGGNTSIDVARTAVRLGAGVTIAYRRSMDEMPARAEEVEHARQEGVRFQMLASPVAALGDEGGHVRKLECSRMELAEPGPDGRRKVRPAASDNFFLEADCVVSATGFIPDPAIADATESLETDERGYIAADLYVCETSVPGVFAGGDAVTGPATVVDAMVAGKHAARGIRRYLYRKRNGMRGVLKGAADRSAL